MDKELFVVLVVMYSYNTLDNNQEQDSRIIDHIKQYKSMTNNYYTVRYIYITYNMFVGSVVLDLVRYHRLADKYF